MVDTYLPLSPTTQAAGLEFKGYHDSWRTPDGSPAPRG